MSRDDCYAGESRLRNSLRISSESDAASPMTLGTFGWITIPPPAVVCQRHEVDLEKRRDWISLRAPLKDVRHARRILERLGVPSATPQAARARDPTHLDDEEHASA